MEEFLSSLATIFGVTTPLWSSLIGGLMAIAGGWQLHKLDAEKVRREQLAEDIAGFLEACSDSFGPRARKEPLGPYQAKAGVASARIVLRLKPRDSDIERITSTMVNNLNTDEARLLLTAVQTALQRWYRGELSASAAVTKCDAHFQQLLAENVPNTR